MAPAAGSDALRLSGLLECPPPRFDLPQTCDDLAAFPELPSAVPTGMSCVHEETAFGGQFSIYVWQDAPGHVAVELVWTTPQEPQLGVYVLSDGATEEIHLFHASSSLVFTSDGTFGTALELGVQSATLHVSGHPADVFSDGTMQPKGFALDNDAYTVLTFPSPEGTLYVDPMVRIALGDEGQLVTYVPGDMRLLGEDFDFALEARSATSLAANMVWEVAAPGAPLPTALFCPSRGA